MLERTYFHTRHLLFLTLVFFCPILLNSLLDWPINFSLQLMDTFNNVFAITHSNELMILCGKGYVRLME